MFKIAYKLNYCLFLKHEYLQPKMSALEGELNRCASDQLINLKENINTLFAKCVETLSHEHHIRVMNALLVSIILCFCKFI